MGALKKGSREHCRRGVGSFAEGESEHCRGRTRDTAAGWLLKFTMLTGGSWAAVTTGGPCVERDRTKIWLLLHGAVTTHPRKGGYCPHGRPITSFTLQDKGIIPEHINRAVSGSSSGELLQSFICPNPGAHGLLPREAEQVCLQPQEDC